MYGWVSFELLLVQVLYPHSCTRVAEEPLPPDYTTFPLADKQALAPLLSFKHYLNTQLSSMRRRPFDRSQAS